MTCNPKVAHHREVEQVIREVELDADCADVWEAITSPDLLAEWFDAAVDGEIATGELVRTADGRRAVIERADAPHRLVFRWIGDAPSRVDISIDPDERGSRVRIVERRIEAAVSSVPRLGFRALART